MGEVIDLTNKQVKEEEHKITPLELIEEVKEILEEQEEVVLIMRSSDGSMAFAHNSLSVETMYWLLSCAKQELMS